ncbi:Integral membrane protein [Mycena indigotica]|uniref:Integral membrane protein n=1 Tax=Mycena indigotica TaxID=2126181 RepID=A0A8H6W7C8_9AGAR|nr:Integral membrane protein [Mycena indigotica]KAF7301974.1 Integral membrane protein [Mycena indigotica]
MPVHFLKTLLLFSKSDVIPILGPSLAVAMVLAGPTDIYSFIMGFAWLELHLLTFEVRSTLDRPLPEPLSDILTQIKNQITGLEEDRLSKPDRPIAAGRLTVFWAQRLYILVGILSVVWSVYHGLLLCSTIYMIAIVCYNELQMSRHWFFKSFLGAIGYAVYCWGTTSIFDHGNALSVTSIVAITCSFLLHVTTGHAQDFRDLSGDAAIGRVTLPMLLPPALARWSLSASIILWTTALAALWLPPPPVIALLAALASVTSMRFVKNIAARDDIHREKLDGKAYWWYNMWLITAHMLPLFTPVVDPLALLPPGPLSLQAAKPIWESLFLSPSPSPSSSR